MKVVILAGGLGTRLSEETAIKPKPMVEIGPEPIIWHIMKIYSHYGYNDFIVCAGYKQHVIKDYFARYAMNHGNIEVFTKSGKVILAEPPKEDWRVTVVDTGINTMTGGRIKRIRKYVESGESFMLTYGDGLADIDINKLIESHKSSGEPLTVTAVQPKGRFGALTIDSRDMVVDFTEKPPGDGMWINGGYYVMESEIFDHIDGDSTVWEDGPMKELAMAKKIHAYKHTSFWKPMDTMTDKRQLEEMWLNGKAPWKVWDE